MSQDNTKPSFRPYYGTEEIIKALPNTDYTIKQVRNIFLIAEGSDLPVGEPGDICLVFSNE